MEDGCGIYRRGHHAATCDKLAELRERFKNINLDDKSSVWNTDWLMAIELDYQLDVAQSMAHSAINRKNRAALTSVSTVGAYSNATTSTSSSTPTPSTCRAARRASRTAT